MFVAVSLPQLEEAIVQGSLRIQVEGVLARQIRNTWEQSGNAILAADPVNTLFSNLKQYFDVNVSQKEGDEALILIFSDACEAAYPSLASLYKGRCVQYAPHTA